ncbi:MAG: type II toxin-antitoxin system prevent-host-death family antitoxin [Acidimicrobiales bacterium]
MTTRIIPKTRLRDQIRDELADLGNDTLVITERGRPVAVVVTVDRWNELQESLEELEDAVAILEHRAGSGRGQPAEPVLTAIEAEEADVSRRARQAG